MTPANNYLTFDIEEWYHANYDSMHIPPNMLKKSTHLEALVDQLLELCDRYTAKATFFIVGAVAKNKPEIVRSIAKHGHEIASHSYNHDLVYNMTPAQFKKDTEHSKKLLEDMSGHRILGYRAPSWSVRKDTLPWYYDTLAAVGYTYSSSVFPLQTSLYGIPDAPRVPHKAQNTKIVEIPSSTVELLGKRIGYSGGAYLRLLPTSLIKYWTDLNTKQQIPTIFYLHPREIDPAQPHIELPMAERFVHYYGIQACLPKFTDLVQTYAPTLRTTLSALAKTVK